MKQLKGRAKLVARYVLPYENEKIKVKLVEKTSTGAPRFFFRVQLHEKKMDLFKVNINGTIFWSGKRLDQHRTLGEAVEDHTGFELPLRERGNPFTYNGEKKVRIESFRMVSVELDRALSLISGAVYYRLHLTHQAIVMVRCNINGSGVWSLEEPVNMHKDDFLFARDTLEGFEKAYQAKKHVPWKVIETR